MKNKCNNCEKTKTKHEYQDEKFGTFVREMNVTKKGKLRCTVCGYEQEQR